MGIIFLSHFSLPTPYSPLPIPPCSLPKRMKTMATPAEIIDSEKAASGSVAIRESYEVAIEKLVYGGDGLAHVGSQAVFVPLAAAGDFARIRIVECERNYARGVIEELSDPSPLRRTPPCQYFGSCGGCPLPHLPYPPPLQP